MTQSFSDKRAELRALYARNHEIAHHALFAHRHPDVTPDFHRQMINDWHSPDPRVLTMAFRGGAKSTIGEEAIAVRAGLGQFRNLVIIGETSQRANERLHSIKREIENNEGFIAVFGELGGSNAETWNEDKVVLNNGVCIQALGRNQAFRGVKHNDARPDELWIDDLENEEAVRSPEAFRDSLGWLLKTVLPGLTPENRIRMTATPLAPRCIPLELERMDSWITRRFPIESIDRITGDRVPTWPGRFPLELIDRLRSDYEALGELRAFLQEYMLDPSDPALKTFREADYRVVPRVRSWHPVYAVYDPARTTGARSATTGKVAFSWIGRKLVVWEGGGYRWMPSEIVEDMCAVDERYSPIAIGVEETGLEEFIREPIRNAVLRRACPLPVRAVKPPRGKLDFIRSLEPFFKAGEIEFAVDLPDAKAQLLGFPTGAIDFPNALAYAPLMRPGAPVYEGFSADHVTDLVRLDPLRPILLAINATAYACTIAVVQVVQGGLSILADAVAEGDPGSTLGFLVADMSALIHAMADGRRTASAPALEPLAVCPPHHFKEMDTIGLVPAARRIPLALRAAGAIVSGREELRGQLLRLSPRTRAPVLQVASTARWTVNAFSGGYARAVSARGIVGEETQDNIYKVLMEGIESLAGSTHMVADTDDRHYDHTADGRRFLTMRGSREPPAQVKLPHAVS
jgi:hypothetical protein